MLQRWIFAGPAQATSDRRVVAVLEMRHGVTWGVFLVVCVGHMQLA